MKKYYFLVSIIISVFCISISSQAQIIKKPKISLKNVGKELLNEIKDEDQSEPESDQEVSDHQRPSESGGKKLKPPDVKTNIDEALKSYESKS